MTFAIGDTVVLRAKNDTAMIYHVKVSDIRIDGIRGTYKCPNDDGTLFDSTTMGINDGVGLFFHDQYERIE